MTGTTPLRTGGKQAVILVVCLWVLAAPTVAVVATAPAGVPGSATTVGGTTAVEGGATTSLAGSTTVQLQPTTVSVGEGGVQTLAVVVTDAEGGVGAISGSISVAESEYATISDFEFRGDPGLDNVTVSDERVAFEGALMDTAQTGSVAVAEVTISGQLEGATDLDLAIDTLGDEDGNPYDVGSTPDAAVTVENTRNEVPLSISADAESAVAGESVTYTVMRTDSNARVRANVTIGSTTVSTGVDGEATVTMGESMVSDAGTITATASKDSTSQERYTNDSVAITHDDSGGGSDGSTDSDNEDDTTSDGAIVRTDPSSIDLAPGETTAIDVIVTDIDGGVGAGNVTVTVGDPEITEITDTTVIDDPGIGSAEILDDSARVSAEFALRDGADEAPVRIVEVTIRGVAAGSTELALSVDSLGDEQGNSYAVASAPESGVRVSADDGSDATATDGHDGTATESRETTQSTATDSGSETTDAGATVTTANDQSTTTSSSDPATPDSDERSVPENPSTALLAFGVVIVILLGLGSLAS